MNKNSGTPPAGATIWLTGLPCSGKTTLARALETELAAKGYKIARLDGDTERAMNKDLGFSAKDRKEHLRRVAYKIRDLRSSGDLIVAAFVSPTNELRNMVKEILGSMHLIYVKCGLEECKKRDIKGMYQKAQKGEIKEFTGVSAPFEEPKADIVIDTEHNDVQACVHQILKYAQYE